METSPGTQSSSGESSSTTVPITTETPSYTQPSISRPSKSAIANATEMPAGPQANTAGTLLLTQESSNGGPSYSSVFNAIETTATKQPNTAQSTFTTMSNTMGIASDSTVPIAKKTEPGIHHSNANLISNPSTASNITKTPSATPASTAESSYSIRSNATETTSQEASNVSQSSNMIIQNITESSESSSTSQPRGAESLGTTVANVKAAAQPSGEEVLSNTTEMSLSAQDTRNAGSSFSAASNTTGPVPTIQPSVGQSSYDTVSNITGPAPTIQSSIAEESDRMVSNATKLAPTEQPNSVKSSYGTGYNNVEKPVSTEEKDVGKPLISTLSNSVKTSLVNQTSSAESLGSVVSLHTTASASSNKGEKSI